MSTNYYAHVGACPTCKRAKKIVHIGKRVGATTSRGIAFRLHVGIGRDDDPPDSLEEWLDLFESHDVVIRDEYDEVIPAAELVEIIGDDYTAMDGYFR